MSLFIAVLNVLKDFFHCISTNVTTLGLSFRDESYDASVVDVFIKFANSDSVRISTSRQKIRSCPIGRIPRIQCFHIAQLVVIDFVFHRASERLQVCCHWQLTASKNRPKSFD
jgi:hypothetical protein